VYLVRAVQFKTYLHENIYQIIKVNGDGLKYGRFNLGERYAVHEAIYRYQKFTKLTDIKFEL